MSPDEISQLRNRQHELARVEGIVARHLRFAMGYEALQKTLKEVGVKHIDFSDLGYLKTTGMGYGLWALGRTKLFKKIDDYWFKSWCGRHRLYINEYDNFHSKIHIKLSR